MPVVVRSHRRLVLVLAALAGVLATGTMGTMVLVLSGVVVRRSDHRRLADALQAAGLGTADVGRLWSGRPAATGSGLVLTPVRSRGRLELHGRPAAGGV